MSNKSLGSAFERELAQILAGRGWWVHLLQGNANGQPSDLIALKDGTAMLVDAKVCSSDTFRLSRMEENQRLAMDMWHSKRCGLAYFALKFIKHDEIYLVSYHWLASLNAPSVDYKTVTKAGFKLERGDNN